MESENKPNVEGLKSYLLENGRDKTYSELALMFNIRGKDGLHSPEKARGYWRRLKTKRIENPMDTESPLKVTNDNGKKTLDYSGENISSLEDLIQASGINLDLWDVSTYKVSSWQDFKDDTKYAVKATFNQTKEIREAARQEFIKACQQHSPVYTAKKYLKAPKGKESVMYTVEAPDLHMGKLGWGKEVGQNYNIEIAREIFKKTVKQLLSYSKLFHVEKILFPIGNDLLNSEGLKMATTRGTPQHDDVRWQKSYMACREVLVEMIDTLRELAPVEVVVVPGNHDYERMFYIGDAIYAWYNNCKEVIVNNDPSPRKYVTYGKTMIGFTHGSAEKVDNLPLIMATEKSKEWSNVIHTEWHIGHVHKSKHVKWLDVDERFGTVIRVLPSLSGTDAWHHEHGYVGNTRSAQSYIYSKESGYRGHFQVSVSELDINYSVK